IALRGGEPRPALLRQGSGNHRVDRAVEPSDRTSRRVAVLDVGEKADVRMPGHHFLEQRRPATASAEDEDEARLCHGDPASSGGADRDPIAEAAAAKTTKYQSTTDWVMRL